MLLVGHQNNKGTATTLTSNTNPQHLPVMTSQSWHGNAMKPRVGEQRSNAHERKENKSLAILTYTVVYTVHFTFVIQIFGVSFNIVSSNLSKIDQM